jgi:hypothetical protein
MCTPTQIGSLYRNEYRNVKLAGATREEWRGLTDELIGEGFYILEFYCYWKNENRGYLIISQKEVLLMIKYWEDSSVCKVLFFYLRKYYTTFSYGISK